MAIITKRTPALCEQYVETDPYNYLTDNRYPENLLEGMLELEAVLEPLEDEVVNARTVGTVTYDNLSDRLDGTASRYHYRVEGIATFPPDSPGAGTSWLVGAEQAFGDWYGQTPNKLAYTPDGTTWQFSDLIEEDLVSIRGDSAVAYLNHSFGRKMPTSVTLNGWTGNVGDIDEGCISPEVAGSPGISNTINGTTSDMLAINFQASGVPLLVGPDAQRYYVLLTYDNPTITNITLYLLEEGVAVATLASYSGGSVPASGTTVMVEWDSALLADRSGQGTTSLGIGVRFTTSATSTLTIEAVNWLYPIGTGRPGAIYQVYFPSGGLDPVHTYTMGGTPLERSASCKLFEVGSLNRPGHWNAVPYTSGNDVAVDLWQHHNVLHFASVGAGQKLLLPSVAAGGVVAGCEVIVVNGSATTSLSIQIAGTEQFLFSNGIQGTTLNLPPKRMVRLIGGPFGGATYHYLAFSDGVVVSE